VLSKIVDLWLTVKPIARIKAHKARKRLLQEEQRMEINTGFRTSTNGSVAGLAVYGILQLVTHFAPEFPTAGLEEFLGAVAAFIVARLSKTQVAPGIL
jgi:hypothetical protein